MIRLESGSCQIKFDCKESIYFDRVPDARRLSAACAPDRPVACDYGSPLEQLSFSACWSALLYFSVVLLQNKMRRTAARAVRAAECSGTSQSCIPTTARSSL